MNAAAALSRVWRRLVIRVRALRQMPLTLHVPATSALGVHQQPQGGGSDPGSHPARRARWSTQDVDTLILNDTTHDLDVAFSFERERDRDKLRIWIRDA